MNHAPFWEVTELYLMSEVKTKFEISFKIMYMKVRNSQGSHCVLIIDIIYLATLTVQVW